MWQKIIELSQKILKVTNKTEENAGKINQLQKNQLILSREIAKLKTDLKLERQKNQQQKEYYRSEIERFKAESDNKIKELEILLLRAKTEFLTSLVRPPELPDSDSDSDSEK